MLLITVPSRPWPYPGVIPPTLVPEADAVLQTRLERHNSFKQPLVLMSFSLPLPRPSHGIRVTALAV